MKKRLIFRKSIKSKLFSFDDRFEIEHILEFLQNMQSDGATHIIFGYTDDRDAIPECLNIHGFVSTIETDKEYEERVQAMAATRESNEAKRRALYLELKKEFEDEQQ